MELRPATREKLGAVIVGDGFNVTENGVLTIDEKSIKRDEYVEFTRARLENLYRASKSRRRKR